MAATPYTRHDLRAEAEEALARLWFVQRAEVHSRTEITFAVRLTIRPDLFVQAFLGDVSGALYLALIEGGSRIYGLDREGGAWHRHPYDAPDRHVPADDPGPCPLLTFLSQVEDLLLTHTLL